MYTSAATSFTKTHHFHSHLLASPATTHAPLLGLLISALRQPLPPRPYCSHLLDPSRTGPIQLHHHHHIPSHFFLAAPVGSWVPSRICPEVLRKRKILQKKIRVVIVGILNDVMIVVSSSAMTHNTFLKRQGRDGRWTIKLHRLFVSWRVGFRSLHLFPLRCR